jgi:hypothetical protein
MSGIINDIPGAPPVLALLTNPTGASILFRMFALYFLHAIVC